jgi:hypothetical protein
MFTPSRDWKSMKADRTPRDNAHIVIPTFLSIRRSQKHEWIRTLKHPAFNFHAVLYTTEPWDEYYLVIDESSQPTGAPRQCADGADRLDWLD